MLADSCFLQTVSQLWVRYEGDPNVSDTICHFACNVAARIFRVARCRGLIHILLILAVVSLAVHFFRRPSAA